MDIKRVYDKLHLQENRRKMILMQAVTICIFVVFILPFISLGINIALNRSKFSYLTKENIIYFLINPMTIFIILIVLLGISIFVQLISASFLFLYEDNHNTKSNGISYYLMVGIKETVSSYWRTDILVSIFYTFYIAFLNIPLIIIALVNSRIPYYILKSLLHVTLGKVLLLLVLIVCITFFYHGIFILPIGIFEKKGLIQGYKKSYEMLRGNHKTVINSMLKFNLLYVLCYGVVYIILILLIVLFVLVFAEDEIAVALFLKTINQLNGYYCILIIVIGYTLNIGRIYNLYNKITNDKKSEVDKKMIEAKKLVQLYVYPKRVKHFLLIFVALSILSIVGYFGDSIRNGSFALEESLLGIQITSHRGNSSSAPESTMEAIESAINELADYVEIDVQQTKDGVVVLLHDKSLYRTTGLRRNIWDVNYEELVELDAGSWFSKEYKGAKIPTLEEVLIACKGRIKLNIEVKDNGHNPDLINQVITLIEEYDYERQCVISSVNLNFLVKAKELNENIKTGYIMSFAYGDFFDTKYVDFFSIKSTFITERTVREAHIRGKEVHAWTVNTKSEMERMKSIGVDNIITDRPVRGREVLYGDVTDSFLQYLKLVFRKI